MSNQANVTRLLIEEPPLLVMPSLAVAIGLNEAIVVQQIHYWQRQSKNVRDGRAWVYNTLEDWHKQFPFWSIRTLHRIFDSLRNAGILRTGSFNENFLDRTAWYSLDYDKLAEKAGALPFRQVGKMGGSDSLPCGQVVQMHDDNLSTSTISTETNLAEIPFSDPLPKRKRKPTAPKKETPADEMFSRLCFILYGHQLYGTLSDKQRGILNTEGKRLRDGAKATPDDLGNWYKEVWRHNWPGNTGQHPSVSQVLAGVAEYIEKGRDATTCVHTNGHNGNGNGKVKLSEIPNTGTWDNMKGVHATLNDTDIPGF